MDKELNKILKELNGVLGDMVEIIQNDITDKLDKDIQKAGKEKCIISMETFENGKSNLHIEGSNLALLVNLAGLENAILKKLDPPVGLWELIKDVTHTKENNDNE